MSSHLLWFRLMYGKVWHVAASGSPVALCGQSVPDRGERQPKRPPFGARPCPDCDHVANEARESVDAAALKFVCGGGLRTPTDPEDDGDLPDLLGQDGEVTVR